MKTHDFRQQSTKGYWVKSDTCYKCGVSCEETEEDGMCETDILNRTFMATASNQPRAVMPGSDDFEAMVAGCKIRVIYLAKENQLLFYEMRTFSSDVLLENFVLGNTTAELMTHATPMRATGGAAGGAIIGSLIFPVVGTAIGAVAGASGKARKNTISLAGDVNFVFEMQHSQDAFHLANLINTAAQRHSSGSPQ